MKIIAGLFLFLNLVLVINICESEYLYRGINCEFIYLEGRVDSIKSLDNIKDVLKKKNLKDNIKIIEIYQKYMTDISTIENSSTCVRLELTVLERSYLSLKGKYENLVK